MKIKNICKVICFITIILSLFIGTNADAQISREEALESIVNNILQGNTKNLMIYATKNTVPSETNIYSLSNLLAKTNAESWLFFIDDQPMANWEHPCRYVVGMHQSIMLKCLQMISKIGIW
jgi:hypothetical protein